MLKVIALLTVRNEEFHIERCINSLIREGIETIVIDNESTDNTKNIALKYLNKGVNKIVDLPWRGYFSLNEQIQNKRKLISKLDCDWLIHVDADEWLHSTNSNESLSESLEFVDKQGFNCVNFDEFVFLPLREENHFPLNYDQTIVHYFFKKDKKCPQRFMRAWKRNANLKQICGGHILKGKNLKVYPENFVLRHYITLNQEFIINKYKNRIYSQQELNRKMHWDRINLSEELLKLPEKTKLKKLDYWNSRNLEKDVEYYSEYWLWEK